MYVYMCVCVHTYAGRLRLQKCGLREAVVECAADKRKAKEPAARFIFQSVRRAVGICQSSFVVVVVRRRRRRRRSRWPPSTVSRVSHLEIYHAPASLRGGNRVVTYPPRVVFTAQNSLHGGCS